MASSGSFWRESETRTTALMKNNIFHEKQRVMMEKK